MNIFWNTSVFIFFEISMRNRACTIWYEILSISNALGICKTMKRNYNDPDLRVKLRKLTLNQLLFFPFISTHIYYLCAEIQQYLMKTHHNGAITKLKSDSNYAILFNIWPHQKWFIFTFLQIISKDSSQLIKPI